MNTLIIVDFQNDFAKSNGALYVKGSEEAYQNLIDYINKHHNEISDVVFTVDWHPINHCSFKQYGGVWPEHCVQYSEGAGIPDELIHCVNNYNIDIKFFIKGNSESAEEYGAFNSVGTFYVHKDDAFITVNNINKNSHLIFNTNNIVVCGIAGDYCVKNTIKNLLKYDGVIPMNIKVLENCIASIDDGTTIKNFIKENNLKTI